MSAVASLLVLLPMGLLMAHAAWTDVTTRRIANGTSLGIAALLPLRVLLSGEPTAFVGHLGSGLAVFVAGYGLWSARLIGGGDVKLAAALALNVGMAGLASFLLLTSLVGGVLALGCLAVGLAGRRATPLATPAPAEPDGAPARRELPTVPYGVAIVVGAAAAMLTG